MDNETVNTIFENTFTKVKELRKYKGGEYAGDFDALANFKRNAEACGITPETCWRIYAGKHWDAITQFINDLQSGKTRVRAEPIEGRIDDLITYLCLLHCMIIERKESRMPPL